MNVLLASAQTAVESLSKNLLDYLADAFPTYKYQPRDAELAQIEGIFRSQNPFKANRLYLAVTWRDGIRSSLPLEMAALAAPGRRVAVDHVKAETTYRRIKVRIQAAISRENEANTASVGRFSYQTDKGQISLSGFEIARALFFHNPYLASAAFQAGGFHEYACVDRRCSPVQIRFAGDTGYPLALLASSGARAHFAWLMLDPQAKRSFRSIYQQCQPSADATEFRFTPPDLTGWQLEVALFDTQQGSALQVQRIERVLYAKMAETFAAVEFHHPDARFQPLPDSDSEESAQPELPSFSGPLDNRVDQRCRFLVPSIATTTLTDGREPLAAEPVQPETVAPVQETTAPERESVTEQEPVTAQQPIPEAVEPFAVVPNDSVSAVVVPAAEIGDTRVAAQPHEFVIFEKMAQTLGEQAWIELTSVACDQFPEPTNNSTLIYRTTYEGRLKYFVATLVIDKREVLLLEADTANLQKSKGASTLILCLKADAEAHLAEILQLFSDNGAQWRLKQVGERCIKDDRCPHPSWSVDGETLIESAYVERWAARVQEKLKGFLS